MHCSKQECGTVKCDYINCSAVHSSVLQNNVVQCGIVHFTMLMTVQLGAMCSALQSSALSVAFLQWFPGMLRSMHYCGYYHYSGHNGTVMHLILLYCIVQ